MYGVHGVQRVGADRLHRASVVLDKHCGRAEAVCKSLGCLVARREL